MTSTITKLRSKLAATNYLLEDLETAIAGNAEPTFFVKDMFIGTGATSVNCTIYLSGPAVTDIEVNLSTRNGTAIAGSDYTSFQKVQKAIRQGQSSLTFVVGMNSSMGNGEYFYVDCSLTSTAPYGTAVAANTSGTFYIKAIKITKDTSRSAYVPSNYGKVYSSNLVSDWEANDRGIGSASPTWSTRIGPASDYQGSNGEASVYADPTLHTNCNPFPTIGGKRGLRVGIPLGSGHIVSRFPAATDKTYYGAALISMPFLEFRKGYIEFKAQLCAARGSWPALWTFGRTTFFEQDLVEYGVNGVISANRATPNAMLLSSIHWPNNDDFTITTGSGTRSFAVDTSQLAGVTASDLAAEYHVYGILFDDTQEIHYIDGVQMQSFPRWAPPDVGQYLLMDNTLGAALGGAIVDGDITGTDSDASMIVEYASFYAETTSKPTAGQPRDYFYAAPVPSGRSGSTFDPDWTTLYLDLQTSNTTIANLEVSDGVCAGWRQLSRVYGNCAANQKRYIKFLITAPVSSNTAVGLVTNNWSRVDGFTGPGLIEFQRGGTITIGTTAIPSVETVIGTSQAYSNGCQIEIVVSIDSGGATGKVWSRVTSALGVVGNWNNNGSADPATNTGGFDIAAALATGSLIHPIATIFSASGVNEAISIVSATPPSGFSNF